MYFSKLLVSDIIEYAVSKGADQEDLCRNLGIQLNDKINPNDVVSYEKMVNILNHVGQLIDDELLGLHLGEQLILKGTKQVDQIMQNSPNIEEAFSNAINYSKLISDALSTKMEKTESQTKISFEVNPNWAVLPNHAVQQIIDMTLVCTLKSIYWLTGRKYAPMAVNLNYSALKKRNEYYRVFDCSVKFEESTPCIIFHNPVLNQTVPSYDLGLLAYLKKIGTEEIEKLQSEDPLQLQIKKIILNNLPQKSTIDIVASELHLSSRTMQRKLKQGQTNFKQIEKDILIKLAKKIIRYEKRSIDEISYLLGFSEASAFIRFFKNEVNATPKKYKQQHSI